MRDGAVYAGISPDTGRPMYAAAEDEPDIMSLPRAIKRAEELSRETNRDYRVPSFPELRQLFNNSAMIGGFNKKGPYPKDWYLSASITPEGEVEILRFSDGDFSTAKPSDAMSVCLVRN